MTDIVERLSDGVTSPLTGDALVRALRKLYGRSPIILRAADELESWARWGVIEIMIRNPNVDSFVKEKEAEIDRLRAELSSLRGGWRPIESAPKDGKDILLGWTWDGHVEQGHWRQSPGDGCWYAYQSGYFPSKNWPDLWQPLPALSQPSHGEG